jgi:hypothetical protein
MAIMRNIFDNLHTAVELSRAAIERRNEIQTSWNELDSKMPKVIKAFNQVRGELEEVGLLEEGEYLDEIELVVSPLPSGNAEAGYVYENLNWVQWIVGYRTGVIYLPSDLPYDAYVPGGTLTDTIRHEFGHAWHWLDERFFEKKWFTKAFRTSYDDPDPVALHKLIKRTQKDEKFQSELESKRSEKGVEALLKRYFEQEFVSLYASTRACEDFAETFMFYLRYRNSLHRFSNREGVFKKLLAIQNAVEKKREKLGL